MGANNYSDLLETPEWKEKRHLILKRDKHTCQRCGVGWNRKLKTHKQLLPFSNFLEFVPLEKRTEDRRNVRMKVHPDHPGIPLKSDLNLQELNDLSSLAFIAHIGFKNHIKYPFHATLGTCHFDPEVHKLVEEDFFLSLIRKKLKPHWDVDLEGFYVIDTKRTWDYMVAKDNILLHVHHKCYRKGVDIWAQSNDEYVTLCNTCHQIIHENQKIPFYGYNGKEIQNLPDCSRCSGEGFLKIYKHVQDGVCFKCHGKGKIIK